MKLYQNKAWLYRRYIIQKKSITVIAQECGVSTMTIQRYVQEFGLVKKR